MPATDTHPPPTDLQGAWSGEVRFTGGPLAGHIHHESWLFADDAILVHLRTRRGVGEWKCEGHHLSLAFYEVILNDAGKPNGVVHITSTGTLAPDRNTFEAIGRGDLYGLGGELVATNHTAARGWRADRSGDVNKASSAGERMADMDDFNAKVVQEFRVNGGKVGPGLARGRPFQGVPMILLHHRGAKSGVERVNPLVYQPVGDSFAIFASKGGSPAHPDWYRNLMANPNTRVEVGTDTFDVTARELHGQERDVVWERQKRLTPVFSEYEEKTKGTRRIPVILLEKRS